MLLLKTKRPSTLTGRNVRLSNLLISSCYIISLIALILPTVPPCFTITRC